MRRVWLILLSLCVASRLPAQWQVTADAGGAHLRQTGIPESNALTMGASADALGERTALRSRLLLSRAANERWTGQGVLLASILGPNTTGPNWELSGALSGFGETNAPSTTSTEGMARLRLGGTTAGGAIGAALGALSDAAGARALYRAQVTTWRTFAVDQIVSDASFVGTFGSDRGGPLLVDATRYVDLSASWRRDHRGFELGATAGFRAAMSGVSNGGWGSVDAAAWIAPNLALVASAGRSLEDIPRGVPRTQYASIALRIAVRSHPSVLDARPAAPAPKTVITRDGIVLHVDGASTVELMADFTDWAIVALEHSGNEWRLDRAVPPGLHRVAMRVDGGEWTAPPGLPRATDELGGVVGLVTVP
jgi:hypothetical protein